MSERPPYRDEELALALAELDVPEHEPGFHAELHRRLAEERAARAPIAHRRLQRRARAPWGVRIAAVATVAVAAAVVVFAVGIPHGEQGRIGGPSVASAALVKERVRQALATLASAGGIVVSDGPQKHDLARWRFLLTSQGDFRLEGLTERERIAYDAKRGVVRRAGTSASLGGGALFYSVRRGVAPGPPDEGPPTWILPQELGSYVHALLAADDPRVTAARYRGRAAWRVDVDVTPNPLAGGFSGDRLAITVDRRTGIPVRVVERKGHAFLQELRIDRLAVNPDVPPDAFRLAFPPGVEVLRMDDGFRRVPLARAQAVVGYPPLVPSYVPRGYHPAEVAVAREAAPTGAEAGNPPSRDVVSLSYRRGLDQFLVTTRLADVEAAGEPGRSPQELWSDPLATGEGFRDIPEPVRLRTGALAGADTQLVIMPRGIPHLWALTDDLVVTVGGDLSRTELLRVARSLTPAPGQ